ncbi:MAG TPA: hypothetical protein VMF88_01950 [Bacteroidota bacterium]|nr:hypothetical protein [Bacteroidota bacterium]
MNTVEDVPPLLKQFPDAGEVSARRLSVCRGCRFKKQLEKTCELFVASARRLVILNTRCYGPV